MARKFWKSRESGQAMVEFALVLPILLIFLCGIIDFGWIFYNQIAINNACREGARYASVHYTQYLSAPGTLQTNTTNWVSDSATGITTPLEITLDTGTSGQVTVTVKESVPVLTGITSLVIGDNVDLTATSIMKTEN